MRILTATAIAALTASLYYAFEDVGPNYAQDTETAPPARPDSKRLLTANEIEQAHNIYGSALNLNETQIYFYDDYLSWNVSSAYIGDTPVILIKNRHYKSDDYTLEKDADLYGTFFYELTRLHYHYTYDKSESNNSNYYSDILNGASRIEDFDAESQSQIMSDYVRRFFHNEYKSLYLQDKTGWESCHNDNLLRRAVESTFPDARDARIDHHKQYERPLTDNEKYWLQVFFSDQIHTDNVNLYLSPLNCDDWAASVKYKNRADFWGKGYHSDDYTAQTTHKAFNTFAHELVHIWQRHTKNRMTNHKFINEGDKYAYPLDTNKWSFNNYSSEQQGAIVQDYVGYFMHESQKTDRIEQTADNLKELKDLVEEFFPGARTLREHFEKHGKLPQAPQKDTMPLSYVPADTIKKVDNYSVRYG